MAKHNTRSSKSKPTKAKPPSSSSSEQEQHPSPSEDQTDFVFMENTESNFTLKTVVDKINLLRSELLNKIEENKSEIIDQLITENKALTNEISNLKDSLKQKDKKITSLEKDVLNLQQYVRRNNLEICGIPDEISDADLEDKVIAIAKSIDVEFTKSDIEACHRLKKGKNERYARTIIRFVNRKSCDNLHKNKKNLKNAKVKLSAIGIQGNIFINCNLAPYSKYLWSKCKKLYDDKIINRFWVYNGSIFIASREDDNGRKIEHMNDLVNTFPGYDFETKF